jgi:hypothetical protein
MRNDPLFDACRFVRALQNPSAASRDFREFPRRRSPTVASTTRDWNYLVRAADRQGIGPLVHEWLRRSEAVSIPVEALRKLADLYWTQHFRNRVLLAELARVTGAAESRNLRFIPLKGAVLATDFYPAPALRPMSDLDLLVRADDFARMGDMLDTLGYVPWHAAPSYVDDPSLSEQSREHVWTTNRDGIDAVIEYRGAALQTTIGRLGDLDATLVDASREYTNAMWSRAELASVKGANALRPSQEDLLLHVAGHLAAQHSDFRLIWLLDLTRILDRMPDRSFDWDYVCTSAASLRISVPVWAALQAAAQWLGAQVPGYALERLLLAAGHRSNSVLHRWEERRLREHVASLGDADLSMSGFALWPFGAAIGRMHGWRPKLAAFRRALFPSRDYLMRHGDQPPGAAGYAKNWLRRAVQASANLFGG